MDNQEIFDSNTEFEGVKGLVYIGDKIIVCRRDNKTPNFPLMMDLPGGGREIGESPFETFKREIFEELGLELKKEDVVFSKKYKSVLDGVQDVFFIVVKHTGMAESEIKFGNEGLYYTLMDPNEFCKLDDAVQMHQDKVAEYIKIQNS